MREFLAFCLIVLIIAMGAVVILAPRISAALQQKGIRDEVQNVGGVATTQHNTRVQRLG
jgi:hypothetical protein